MIWKRKPSVESDETSPDYAELWLECPRCKGKIFTLRMAQYGAEAACFNCPTFIGILVSTVDYSSPPRMRFP